jgi:hypothetical protein
MEAEDFVDERVGLVVAAHAVAFLPPVRRVLRRGLVYGVAGVIGAGDLVAGFMRGVRRAGGTGTTPEGATEAAEPAGGEGSEPARLRARGPAAREGRRTSTRDREQEQEEVRDGHHAE